MGIQKRKFNFRFGEQTVRKLLEIQDSFQPWCPTLTSTVERTIDFWHLVTTTEGTLEKVWEVVQGKHCGTSPYTSSSLGEAKPGPLKLPSARSTQLGRPRVISHQFTASAGSANLRTGRLRIASQVSFLGFARYTQLRSIRLDSYSNRERVA
jgi:hypothetical protein